MTRRNAAKFLAGVAGAVAVGTFTIPYLTNIAGVAAASGESVEAAAAKAVKHVEGTRLVDVHGKPITVSSLPAGSGKSMTVYPEAKKGGPLLSRTSAIVLLRFDPSQFKPPTDISGTVQGYVAYSKVCTHAGCPVSGRYKQYMYCPCHLGVFDPLAGAKGVGGPVPRPLPQLPIGLSSTGEMIVATGPFSGPVGPRY